jgi:hypothetical protein
MFLPLGVMKAEPQILNVLEDLVHRHSRLLVFTGSQFQSGLIKVFKDRATGNDVRDTSSGKSWLTVYLPAG